MQKQKLIPRIEPQFFLAMQATYDHVEIGLFEQAQCVDVVQEDKMRASKNFVMLLESLLHRNQINLSAIGFIAVNQGPGLFSALRSVIVSANGLSFARQIPLVGVDGLKAFVHEHTHQDSPIAVALLNAFNHEVYYAIEYNNDVVATGYGAITTVLDAVRVQYQGQKVRFIGNGVALYRAAIVAQFAEYAYIPEPLPQIVSIKQVGITGLQQWHAQDFTDQLFPLYLKQHAAQIALEKKA